MSRVDWLSQPLSESLSVAVRERIRTCESPRRTRQRPERIWDEQRGYTSQAMFRAKGPPKPSLRIPAFTGRLHRPVRTAPLRIPPNGLHPLEPCKPRAFRPYTLTKGVPPSGIL